MTPVTRGRILLVGGLLCAVALSAGLLLHRGDGLDHVADVADLHGCERVVRHRPADDATVSSWGRASASGTVDCERGRGHVAWVRFPSRTALARDLREHPSRQPVCVYGQEAVVDRLLVPPGPRVLCRRLGGNVQLGE